MPDRGEYTNGDAADIIENEGVGYAVQHYIDGEWFKDPVTALLWTAADNALTALLAHINRETGREVQ